MSDNREKRAAYTGRGRELVDRWATGGDPQPPLSSTGETRPPQYRQGYRAASKDAVQWLHEQAASMNDPHAVMVLNAAATGLGRYMKGASDV